MSDLMLLGVLRMPIDATDVVAVHQLQTRANLAADRIEADAITIEQLTKEIASLRQIVAGKTENQSALEGVIDRVKRELPNDNKVIILLEKGFDQVELVDAKSFIKINSNYSLAETVELALKFALKKG